ncbi:MAG TPA: winged helix-turn-helix domain-containing protein [Nitrososphaeraceae archaeon]|jgi:predicted transcriptional regulator
MTNKAIIWTDCSTTIVLEILEASKNGITKKEIMNKSSTLSHAQLRRCLAELIDRRLLHYDEIQRIYNTTDRGLILIENIQSQNKGS